MLLRVILPDVVGGSHKTGNHLIINKGAAWFAAKGANGSTGTKIFALTGRVKNTGLVEVSMGTSLRKIVYDIGGGA